MLNKQIYNADEIFTDDPDNPENTLMKIPEEIAERIGWQPGDVLKITWEDGAISITKVDNGKE
jgi:hypothetical protein